MSKLTTALILFLAMQSASSMGEEVGDQSWQTAELGAYRIGLGLFQPDFSEAENYEDFYEKPALGAALSIEHYPWEWAVTLGYALRIGYYQDAGKAGRIINESIEAETQSPIDFTMLPVQVAVSLLATPFPDSKWFTIVGWFGFERTIFNETRRLDSAGSSETDQKEVYTNFGYKNATVVGAGLNILIRAKNSGSTTDVIGLRRVFLSPYIETVSSSDDTGLLLGGTRAGLAFSFELNDG